MATTSAQVQQLYVAYLGRAADKAGLDYWLNELNADTPTLTLENLRANFVTEQPEYAAIYGGLDRSAQVTKIYENLFGRAPDAAGLTYWTTGEGSTVNADQLLTAFINGAAASDATVVNNKVFVAQAYTDAAGADFNANAAASVIADVDGTSASVSAALTAINTGTLEGQVPGLNQIEALAAAHDAVTAHETANQAAVDALAAKLDVTYTPAEDTFAEQLTAVVDAATGARNTIAGGTATSVLEAQAVAAANVTTTAYKALTPTVQAQADKYVAAIAAEATAKAGVATDAEYSAVIAGLQNDASSATGLAGATAQTVYSNYVNGTAESRAAIETAFKDSTYFATFKAAADKDAAYADALNATAAAKDALDADTHGATSVTLHADTATSLSIDIAAGAVVGTADTYVNALQSKTVADGTLADAQAADANLAAATALQDAYAVQTGAVTTAEEAVAAVNVTGKVAVHDLPADHAGTGTVAAPVKDVFYFADKADVTDATNINVTSFGAGDSIVLGNNTYTYNSGAQSTGDNNKLEFFLVKSGSDLQVVLETDAFGSASVATNATTGAVTNANNDHVALITLTGVAAADVTVHNGVISHVA